VSNRKLSGKCYEIIWGKETKTQHSFVMTAFFLVVVVVIVVVRECLLSFGAESFVFQVAIQELKDQDI